MAKKSLFGAERWTHKKPCKQAQPKRTGMKDVSERRKDKKMNIFLKKRASAYCIRQ